MTQISAQILFIFQNYFAANWVQLIEIAIEREL